MFSTLLTIKEAFRGFVKNFWWNAVVLFLMVVSFLAFSVFFIANENIKHITDELNEQMVVRVNLAEDIVEIDSLVKEIEKMRDVETVEYRTKEAVLEEVKAEMGEEEAAVLRTFDGMNIFPAQLVVTLETPENIEAVAEKLRGKEFADDVYFGEKYVDNFLKVTGDLKDIGMIAAIVGIMMVVFVIVFVIKMNVEQRKEEIHIKSLIGASGFVIRMPFIWEALILGVISFLIVFFGFSKGYEKVVSAMAAENVLLNKGVYLVEYGFMLFVAILLVTLLGSVYATAKHVRKI